MKILDIDLDYFMTSIASFVDENSEERLDEDYYGESVWEEEQVRKFLENNLKLSKENKRNGRIVKGHNESLFFWKELISKNMLTIPFEVIHVDSHADLGLGYPCALKYISNQLLSYPVQDRPKHNRYITRKGTIAQEGIGDYLLWAVAYQWISKIIYCGNPNEIPNDYDLYTLKNFSEKDIFHLPVKNTIQLLYNKNELPLPNLSEGTRQIKEYISQCDKEPEVPFIIIPTINDVSFDGNYDFVVIAQSPNYTPASADYILDLLKEYINII